MIYFVCFRSIVEHCMARTCSAGFGEICAYIPDVIHMALIQNEFQLYLQFFSEHFSESFGIKGKSDTLRNQ